MDDIISREVEYHARRAYARIYGPLGLPADLRADILDDIRSEMRVTAYDCIRYRGNLQRAGFRTYLASALSHTADHLAAANIADRRARLAALEAYRLSASAQLPAASRCRCSDDCPSIDSASDTSASASVSASDASPGTGPGHALAPTAAQDTSADTAALLARFTPWDACVAHELIAPCPQVITATRAAEARAGQSASHAQAHAHTSTHARVEAISAVYGVPISDVHAAVGRIRRVLLSTSTSASASSPASASSLPISSSPRQRRARRTS